MSSQSCMDSAVVNELSALVAPRVVTEPPLEPPVAPPPVVEVPPVLAEPPVVVVLPPVLTEPPVVELPPVFPELPPPEPLLHPTVTKGQASITAVTNPIEPFRISPLERWYLGFSLGSAEQKAW